MSTTSGSVAERMYYGSAVLEFEAEVTDIRLKAKDGEGQVWQIALDRTAFYPEGGGQPFDTGVLIATARSGATLEVPVERVDEDDDGEVWHTVRKPLMAGTEITGRVDAVRRLDHEQQHSGQHLLSAMFWRELQAPTVSFHLGADVVTIDLGIKDKPTEEQLLRVEAAANRVVYEQRAMISTMVEREYAEEMLSRGDLRKLPTRPGRIRIMQMQGIEFNACGGTHVRNTGEIQVVLIRRVDKVKQGWRVEFVCGGRAIKTAQRDHELISEAARSLSIGASDVPERVVKLMDEKKALGKEVKRLVAELGR